jgi:hypothetical protein
MTEEEARAEATRRNQELGIRSKGSYWIEIQRPDGSWLPEERSGGPTPRREPMARKRWVLAALTASVAVVGVGVWQAIDGRWYGYVLDFVGALSVVGLLIRLSRDPDAAFRTVLDWYENFGRAGPYGGP